MANRRQFLKAAGALAAGLLAYPLSKRNEPAQTLYCFEDGQLIAVWNRCLTDAEINALFTMHPPLTYEELMREAL